MFLRQLTSVHTLRLSMRWLAWIGAFVSLCLIVGMQYELWLLDLLVSFGPQVIFGLYSLLLFVVMCYTYCVIRVDDYLKTKINRRDTYSVITCVVLIVVASGILFMRGSINVPPTQAGKNRFTIATFNMLYTNDDTSLVSEQIRSKSAGIIGFQEIMPNEIDEIKARIGYEYSFVTDGDISAHNTEVGIISRYPITEASLIYGYENGGIIRAEVLVGSQTVVVYVGHLTPPYSNSDFERRGTLFDIAAQSIEAETLPTFMVGDFNTVVYSKQMRDFLSEVASTSYLVTDRGLPECSWFGFGSALCLRIDHILVPRGFSASIDEIGEYAGSDHRPTFVEVQY